MNDIEHKLNTQLRKTASTIADPTLVPRSLRDTIRRRHARQRGLAAGAAAVVTAPAVAFAVAEMRRGTDATEVTSAPVESTATVQRGTPADRGAPMSAPLTTATPVASTLPAWDGSPSMPLASPSQVSCVTDYTLEQLSERGFAFDGTVVSVEAPAGPGTVPAAELDSLPIINATLEVHEWFKAGDSNITSITVAMPPPDDTSELNDPTWWGVGSRLLVTGESRWGTDPLDGPVAWMCGFSRTYDPATADAWRAQLDAD